MVSKWGSICDAPPCHIISREKSWCLTVKQLLKSNVLSSMEVPFSQTRSIENYYLEQLIRTFFCCCCSFLQVHNRGWIRQRERWNGDVKRDHLLTFKALFLPHSHHHLLYAWKWPYVCLKKNSIGIWKWILYQWYVIIVSTSSIN